MINAKFKETGTVGQGAVVGLTYGQFDARRHLLTPVKEAHKGPDDSRRLSYVIERATMFKAGESIGIDGDIDRSLQTALGLDEKQLTKLNRKAATFAVDDASEDFAAGIVAGRKAMLTEVEAYNALLDAVDAAQDAADAVLADEKADDAAKAAAQKAVQDAQAAADAAKPKA